MLLWFGGYIVFIKHKIFINMGSEKYPYFPFCIFEALGAILIFVFIMKKIPKNKFITWWGKNSLILYLVHAVENNFIPWDYVKKIVPLRLGISQVITDIFTYVIRLTFIIIVAYGVLYISNQMKNNRWLFKIIGKKVRY